VSEGIPIGFEMNDSPEEWRPEVTVFYDEACLFCRTGVPWLRRLLLLRRTRLVPAQEVLNVEQARRYGNTWVVVDGTGHFRTEFDSLTHLCRQSPLFCP
jgi:hypothetical protein